MTDTDISIGDEAGQALATYLEPLLRGRRALVVADPESGLAAQLVTLAETVQVVAPDELSIVGSHADAELELVFDDDLDLIWVSDVAELPDPRARAMDAFANALSPDGALVLCAGAEERPRKRRSRGGRPGDALRKLASQVFEEVLVCSQSPFSGFTIDAPDAPQSGTALDQSLVRRGDVAPSWHVAVAADRLPALESRLVVQVPGAGTAPSKEAPGRVAELEKEVEAARKEAEGLRAEVAELDEALERAHAQAERADKGAALLERELDDLTRRRRQDRDDLDRARGRIRSLERDLERTADPDEIEALREEAGQLEQRLVDAGAKIVDLEAEVERRGEIARDLMIDLERARDEAGVAEPAGGPNDEQILVAAELPGSSLLGRDSERVRAMGAELLTYRQHAGERDALQGELQQSRDALRAERAYALGLSLRLEESERALEQMDGAAVEELTDLQEVVDGSEIRARELSDKLADAHQQVEVLQQEASRLGSSDTGTPGEREALAAELAAAQERASDLEQALRESDDVLDRLRGELRSREQERDQAREGLAEARAMLQQAAALEPSSN